MKQKLKETEQNQDRYVRSKLNEDSAHLVKENAYLSDQVSELKKQIDQVFYLGITHSISFYCVRKIMGLRALNSCHQISHFNTNLNLVL